jgi:hypothetical protein
VHFACFQPKGSQTVVQMGEEQMSSNVVSFCDSLLLEIDLALLADIHSTTVHSAICTQYRFGVSPGLHDFVMPSNVALLAILFSSRPVFA